MPILDRVSELNVKLRDYQEEMIIKLHESESKRTILQLETGTGKTIVFMTYSILKSVLNGKRVLVIVGSEELLEQAIKTAKMIKPDISIGRFIGSTRDYDNDIVVSSLQTIKNLHNLIVLDDDFEIIIYDEAHHATSPTSKRVFYRYGVCDLDTAGYDNVDLVTPHVLPTRELIGVTATPERTDQTPLGLIFHDRIDGPPIEWFISEGYLCDLKFVTVETGLDLSDVRSYIGDFSESDLAKKLIKSGYINEISRVIEEYANDRKSILLYVPNVATAKIAAAAIQDDGISCDYVVGAERSRRAGVIERFKRGEIRVLVNCLVLKEGFDAPNADCIINCRPTKSPPLLKQIIGRLTRPFEGKDIGLFLDLGFKRRQDDIISASGLFQQTELQESEQEALTIKQRIILQQQKSGIMSRAIYVFDRIRHKKDLETEEEPEPVVNSESSIPDEDYFEDVPDSVKLLVDTRFLNALGISYSEFDPLYKREMFKIKNNNEQSFLYETCKPRQVERLMELTDINEDDLSVLSFIEAQSLIHMIQNQKPVSERQMNYLKILEYNGEIPKTSQIASRLIGSLLTKKSGGFTKSGRA